MCRFSSISSVSVANASVVYPSKQPITFIYGPGLQSDCRKGGQETKRQRTQAGTGETLKGEVVRIQEYSFLLRELESCARTLTGLPILT